jgi:hypothetical protein
MRLSVGPRPRLGRAARVVVTVRSASGTPVRGATVRAAGAGVARRAARTNRAGKAILQLRPTRKGTLVVRVIRAGFQPTIYSMKIR